MAASQRRALTNCGIKMETGLLLNCQGSKHPSPPALVQADVYNIHRRSLNRAYLCTLTMPSLGYQHSRSHSACALTHLNAQLCEYLCTHAHNSHKLTSVGTQGTCPYLHMCAYRLGNTQVHTRVPSHSGALASMHVSTYKYAYLEQFASVCIQHTCPHIHSSRHKGHTHVILHGCTCI